jgi:hypothetical protein
MTRLMHYVMVALMPGSSRDPDGRSRTKAHYAGRYAVKARGVRRRAYLDATTTCRRCGLTLEERRVTHPADTWDAGHVVAGQVNGELASCNRAAGARAVARKYSGYDW